ncbi:hypothetical protein [Sandaracinus amylolyticus]|uniref:hypothetical protein n=1 Tax=Sandaracinus amylolyticus TaxID=927083 RepID=UPI001F40C155|nr:hypothetical protein [Sandaracinus amylolyticus]UJR86296.1 Hypothetical protein I5071_83800 [Sandaracinus amylolyticus]
MALRSRLFVLSVLLVACGDPTPGPTDAGTQPDASSIDAGVDAAATDDAGIDAALDAGMPDAGPPVEGIISGSCDEIDSELLDPSEFLFENEITFPVRITEADLVHFTEGAREVLEAGTVGGSSVYSEAMSFEVLARCEGATLLASEPGIRYMDPNGTRTDLLVEIDGHRVGVSVTRGMSFPRDAAYPLSEAQRVLTKKLEDIHASTANVDELDRWVKQILHVMTDTPMHAEQLRTAWADLSEETRGDTILLVTVTNGEDAFIYDNEL